MFFVQSQWSKTAASPRYLYSYALYKHYIAFISFTGLPGLSLLSFTFIKCRDSIFVKSRLESKMIKWAIYVPKIRLTRVFPACLDEMLLHAGTFFWSGGRLQGYVAIQTWWPCDTSQGIQDSGFQDPITVSGGARGVFTERLCQNGAACPPSCSVSGTRRISGEIHWFFFQQHSLSEVDKLTNIDRFWFHVAVFLYWDLDLAGAKSVKQRLILPEKLNFLKMMKSSSSGRTFSKDWFQKPVSYSLRFIKIHLLCTSRSLLQGYVYM